MKRLSGDDNNSDAASQHSRAVNGVESNIKADLAAKTMGSSFGDI